MHFIPSAFQITNCRRIDAASGESPRLVRKIDQNLAVTADEKRQLIDTLYGAMIRIAHAGNDGFAAIDKALKLEPRNLSRHHY
jgi:hypothetical protein